MWEVAKVSSLGYKLWFGGNCKLKGRGVLAMILHGQSACWSDGCLAGGVWFCRASEEAWASTGQGFFCSTWKSGGDGEV